MSTQNPEAKILVVEDEAIVAKHIRESLNRLGYETLPSVSSADKALESVDKNRPDLVVMDIVLKGNVDGISVAESINNNYQTPVIFLSAYHDALTLNKAMVTEPFGYIVKPFREENLHSAIQMALSKHKKEQRWKEGYMWFSSVFHNMKTPCLTADKNGRVRSVNPSAVEFMGFVPEDVLDEPLEKCILVLDEMGNKVTLPIRKVLKDGISCVMSQVMVKNKTDQSIPVNLTLAPIVSPAKQIMGIALSCQDNSEHTLSSAEKERLLDDLTQWLDNTSGKVKTTVLCPWCKKVCSDDTNQWVSIEYYIQNNTIVDLSHSICPECSKEIGLDLEKGFDLKG